MPKKTKYQLKKDIINTKKVYALYRQGMTLREIGQIMKKSHEWARQKIKKLDKN